MERIDKSPAEGWRFGFTGLFDGLANYKKIHFVVVCVAFGGGYRYICLLFRYFHLLFFFNGVKRRFFFKMGKNVMFFS